MIYLCAIEDISPIPTKYQEFHGATPPLLRLEGMSPVSKKTHGALSRLKGLQMMKSLLRLSHKPDKKMTVLNYLLSNPLPQNLRIFLVLLLRDLQLTL